MKSILSIIIISILFSGCANLDDNLNESVEIENDENINSISVKEFDKIVNSRLEKLEVSDNGCFEFESYDAEFDECYVDFVCDTDKECDKFDVLYDKYLDKLDDLDFGSEFEDVDIYNDDENSEKVLEITLTSYDINKGLLSEGYNDDVSDEYLDFQSDIKTHNLMFKEFVRLIPSKYFDKDLFEYKVFTDGKDETLAYVSQLENDENKWFLAIDIADYNPNDLKEFQYTLIHEFAHILTLNKNQVDYDINFDECYNYYSGEGCLKSSSYFEKYYNLFWKGADYGIDNVDYYSYENDFVTEYAATNPGEDIAESFTQFVLSKKPSDLSLIKDEKINFFYDFDELVDLRNSIRSQLIKTSRQRVQ